MPMTIGMGTAACARFIQPVRPRALISTPVAMKAPTTWANGACPSACPTRTVPGIVKKWMRGVRCHADKTIVSRPLTKKLPKIHEASWVCDRLP